MKINMIKIKNFRGFGENANDEEGYYIFDDIAKYDLLVLDGFNGYGKTSFFDAIEWCFTDKISRIMEKEEIFYKNNLKQSNYLRFYNKDDSKNKKVRQVEVRVYLDNGISISRTTFNKSLHEQGYISELKIFNEDNEEIKGISIKELLLRNQELDIKDTVSSFILGQENIAKFLRNTRPKDRTESLMKLIGQNEIEIIIEKVDKIKATDIERKKGRLEEQKVKYKEGQNIANSIFSLKGYNSLDTYMSSLNKDIEEISKCTKYGIPSLELEEYLNKTKEIQVLNSIEMLEKIKNLKQHLMQEKNEIYKDYLGLVEYAVLGDITKYINIINNIAWLSKQDINELNKKIAKIEAKKVKYNDAKEYMQKVINNLEVVRVEENRKEITKKNCVKFGDKIWDEIDDFLLKIEQLDNILKQNKLDTSRVNQIDVEIKKHDWEKKKLKWEKYKRILDIIKEKINKYKQDLQLISGVTSEYNQVLSNVQQYIVGLEDVNNCPVCGSEEFKQKSNIQGQDITLMSNKEKLLFILDNTISLGNSRVSSINKNLIRQQEREKLLIDSMIEDLKDIKLVVNIQKGIYETIIDNILEKLNTQKICIMKMENINGNSLEKIKDEKNKVEEMKQNILAVRGKNNYPKDLDLKGVELIINKRKEKCINLLQKFNMWKDEYADAENIDIRLNELNESIKGEYSREIRRNKYIEYKEIKFIYNKTIEIEKYDFIGKDNAKKIEEFLVLEEKIGFNDSQIVELEERLKDKKEIRENIDKVKEQVINKLIKNNELVQWIYDEINPHPFFRKITIDYDKSNGTNIKDSDIFLDHVFSSAQLNVLALSVFLGLGITHNCTKINQLFLDDPIQSMDDINILAYIDVLRDCIDSDEMKKGFIISSHESNFTRLLQIKMRNKKIKIYRFETYSKEGPIIKEL